MRPTYATGARATNGESVPGVQRAANKWEYYYIIYAVQCYYVGRYLYDMGTDNNQFVRVCAVRVYIYICTVKNDNNNNNNRLSYIHYNGPYDCSSTARTSGFGGDRYYTLLYYILWPQGPVPQRCSSGLFGNTRAKNWQRINICSSFAIVHAHTHIIRHRSACVRVWFLLFILLLLH